MYTILIKNTYPTQNSFRKTNTYLVQNKNYALFESYYVPTHLSTLHDYYLLN